MYLGILVVAALTGHSIAGVAQLQPRAATTCYQDNLYRSFIDPRHSSPASSFCSTYIAPANPTIIAGLSTVTATVTRTESITSSAALAKRDVLIQKRATTSSTFTVNFSLYGISRVSSACSCIITSPAAPSGTSTVPSSTTTLTVETTMTVIITVIPSTSTSTDSTSTSTTSTTTSTTDTTISATSAAPTPTGPVCGVRGKTNDLYDRISERTPSSTSSCHSSCLYNAPCKGIYYSGGTCYLYRVNAAGAGFYADASSSYVWYDNECIL